MSDGAVASLPEAGSELPTVASRSRRALFKRLADVVCLPSSRVNAFERSMTADLLMEMLQDAQPEERVRVARRLASISEVPSNLLRYLLREEIAVARSLIEASPRLADADLIDCARAGSLEHRYLIARRRGVNDTVCDVLLERLEPAVIEAVLKNDQTRLSHSAVELLVTATRDHPEIIDLLAKRHELRPNHAYLMFWWADPTARRTLLDRFATAREVLQDAVSDVFEMAAAKSWQDPLTRKALQFIERRQRNREALNHSQYNSLEEAVAATQNGLSRALAEEISYLSGLKPITGVKVLMDPGGEPAAVLCKATGLPKTALRMLWKATGRSVTNDQGMVDPSLAKIIELFNSLAVDKAQTVLRYWNWSLSSALSPALLDAIRTGASAGELSLSLPERSAMMVFGRDLT